MIIAITGGIGSGKSVVSRVLTTLGKKVYDCDKEAKRLMIESEIIRYRLQELFGNSIFDNVTGSLDRKRLAEIIFSDKKQLELVNSIVHPVVKEDMVNWYKSQDDETVWVETAILRESKMDETVDAAWVVDAPLEIRVQRAMCRDKASREYVLARINNQASSRPYSCPIFKIINDDKAAILPQIYNLWNLQ